MFIRGQGDTEDVLVISTEHRDEKAEGHQHHFRMDFSNGSENLTANFGVLIEATDKEWS